MGRSALRPVSLAAVAVAASQLGHAIVYLLRFGGDAASVQATGAHGYFPALSAFLATVVGVGVVGAFVLLAAVRGLRVVPAGWRRRPAVRVFDLLPALFLAQLLLFVGQETAETLASGEPLPSLLELLLWGALGQLPSALVGATIVSWLSSRLEEAWTLLVTAVADLLAEPAAPVLVRCPAPAPDLPLASITPGALRERGPPSLLRVSAS